MTGTGGRDVPGPLESEGVEHPDQAHQAGAGDSEDSELTLAQKRRRARDARRDERRRQREERERERQERREARRAERRRGQKSPAAKDEGAKDEDAKDEGAKDTGAKDKDANDTRKKRGRKRDPERTKARILAAATELFTRCGLNGTSLDDISKEAGVNRGLIYHYFKTKEYLFDQVLARPLADYVQSHLEFLQQREVDVAALSRATRGFFAFLKEHPEMVRLIAWTLAMRRIAADLAQLHFTRALYERAIRRIEEAKERGAIREGVNAPHLLITIIDLCVSWHLSRAEWVEKLDWHGRDPEELDRERLESIIDLLEAGLRPALA